MYEIDRILSASKHLDEISNKKTVFTEDNSIYIKWLSGVISPVAYTLPETSEVARACNEAVAKSGIKIPTFNKCLLQYFKKVSLSVRHFEIDMRFNRFVTVQMTTDIFDDTEFMAKIIDWGSDLKFSIIETLPHDKMVFEIGNIRFKIRKVDIDGRPSLIITKYVILDDLVALICEFTVQDDNQYFTSISHIPLCNSLGAATAKELNFRGSQLDAWRIIKKLPNIIVNKRLSCRNNPNLTADNIEFYDLGMDITTILVTLQFCIMQNRAKGTKKHQEVPVKVYMDSNIAVRERVLYHNVTMKEYGESAESFHRNIGPREAVCYSTPEWETRGHWRHYKNGKKVFIKPHKCRRHGHDGEYSPQVKIIVK